MRWILLALVGLTPVACGGSGDLSSAVVTSLPDGDATGTAASGSYRLTIVTRSCGGTCPTFTVLGFTVNICKAKDSQTHTATVTQTDGHLEVHGSGLFINDLSGGLNADGSFDVGGVDTKTYSGVEMAARARGSISENTLTAEAKARGNGTYDGTSVACYATYDVSGQKM